ncbi:DUF1642 domain-containing protein [Lacticaseibacillus paracasei]|uniref:DUF1642 domain-containing protein n=1 Tax=Lacticaseibacillus paracasei TaxID=1597 RepID=UPI00399373A4
MSEEKLYAVKNDKGEWMSLDGTQTEIWYSNNPTLFKDKSYAEAQSMGRKAHVVELVEPEKVVLTKEQAEIVERAHGDTWPAKYITDNTDDEYYSERILMEAFVNGYTVAKEKKYLVYKVLDGKQKHEYFAQAYRSSIYPGTVSWILTNEVKSGSWAQFTESEIEQYGLQDCEKVWCDSDD